MPNYLHNHPEFKELLRAVEREENIDHSLIEKDYWVMHVLHSLKKNGFDFELKGGTSLSKGYGVIHRFSEDIDIRIEPPVDQVVKTGKNHTKPRDRQTRKIYYDWLTKNIHIDGILEVTRDTIFDNETYMSGGIRLFYKGGAAEMKGIKDGILLEVGFDNVTPNRPLVISSWAYDFALAKGIDVINNRADGVKCYHPGYTFVEKLQAILAKFRKFEKTGELSPTFIRHYYDIACLLGNSEVLEFITTPEYLAHKNRRFSAVDKDVAITAQEAFRMSNPKTRSQFESEYKSTAALYYQGQIPLDEIMRIITVHLARL